MTAPPSHRAAWRLVSPDGRDTLLRRNLPSAPLHDLYHLLLSARWPSLIGCYALAFFAVNALFALLYWLPSGSVVNAATFLDHFFFSVQTMCTIGYGVMAPTGLYANVLATVEAFAGVVTFSIATGIAFAKFSRPTARVLFSRVAVNRTWRGEPSLQFRMANLRGNRIIEAHLNVTLARNEVVDGESMRRFYDLDLVRANATFFALSWTAIHRIDAQSPLYGRTREELERDESEIVISLLGIDEQFAQTVHARHSYVAGELVWNARFADVLVRDQYGRRGIDYSRFHDVIPLGV